MINPKDKVMKDFEDLSRKRNELISNYKGTFYVPLYEATLSSDETKVEKQKNFLKILNKVRISFKRQNDKNTFVKES